MCFESLIFDMVYKEIISISEQGQNLLIFYGKPNDWPRPLCHVCPSVQSTYVRLPYFT